MDSKSRRISLAIYLMVFSLALVSLPTIDLSAEPYTVDLIDENGDKFEEPFFETTLIFETWTSSSGTTYVLEKDTQLSTKDCYLRINSETGKFFLNVYSPEMQSEDSVSGSLLKTGVKIVLTGSNSYRCEAILIPNEDPEKNYNEDFQVEITPGNKSTAVLLPSSSETQVTYKLEVFTAQKISNSDHPEEIAGLSFIFTPRPAVGYHSAEFMDEEKYIDVKVIQDGQPLGTLPTIEDPTNPMQFAGWYSGDIKAEEDMVITSDMTFIAKWIAGDHLVVFHDRGEVVLERYIEDDETISSIEPALEPRYGYEFYGWTKADGTYVSGSTKGSQLTDLTTDLYAAWSEIQPEPDPDDEYTKVVEDIENDDGTITERTTETTTRKDGSKDI